MCQKPSWNSAPGRPIEAFYAWVATEPDGSESICSTVIGTSTVRYPLVSADMDWIKSIRVHAETVRRVHQKPVRLVRFTRCEELEEIQV